MPRRPSRKPEDANQAAHRTVAAIIERSEATAPMKPTKPKKKNAAAVALGKLGGKKGGAARAAALSPERRSEIARLAAERRWENVEG